MDDLSMSVTSKNTQSRIKLINETYTQIEHAFDYQKLIRILNSLFDRLEYHATVATGIPLPGQPINNLLLLNTWKPARNLEIRITSSDIVIQKAIDWPNTFVLKREFNKHSIFSMQNTSNNTQIGILVTPIHSVTGYQGVVVNQFHEDRFSALPHEPQLISYQERNLYYSLLNFAFYRMSSVHPERFVRSGGLTQREKETLSVTALGNTSAATARILHISERTVITHLQNASKKLAVSNRIECVLQAIRYKQIGPGAGLGFYQIENEIFPGHSNILQCESSI